MGHAETQTSLQSSGKSIELEVQPEQWPPHDVKELMQFFLRREREDPAYEGFADCANGLAASLVHLSTRNQDEIDYNHTLKLEVAPEGQGPSEASDVLTFAAYSLTNAKMVEAGETPSQNRYLIQYAGEFEFVPVLFTESYVVDEEGKCQSMRWSVRGNYPPTEVLEENELKQRRTVGIFREEPLNLHILLNRTLDKLPDTDEPEIPKAA